MRYFKIHLIILLSCNDTVQSVALLDSEATASIVIVNKGGDGRHEKKARVEISDREKISRVIDVLSKSEIIEQYKSVSANYGSIVLKFLNSESELMGYYSIIYTVYEGVIIRNDNGGQMYKNDQFVGLVEKHLSL